jgi:hypothetical protein
MKNNVLTYDGYSEINLWWAVKKNRKKEKYFIIYKSSYIHRLLLDIITF